MAAFIRVLQSNETSVTATILVFPCHSPFSVSRSSTASIGERAVSAVLRTFARACHAPIIVVCFPLLTIVC
jgi:hypothetical protein